ncbi:hypothetical protein BAE44_0018591 [Dichanthelium oligosanthes]|uniref:LOB domain-containing protein n=1 Tax=Dichanthelium oligosanthes TaxID=888268 RepID=A0A1E5V5E9_9POAL|nr:hypothetical protein BAE44_0018591 [Dichanthelium oligosanthes]
MPEDEAAAAAAAQQPAQSPCAACKTLRRRCVQGCVFAPYFPGPADGYSSRFAAVHRVFGASNAARMLKDVELPGERARAAETLVEEALARERDPAFGCVSFVGVLQILIEKALEQVARVREEIAGEFGAEAAAEPVDVAAAYPEVRLEARKQAEAALAHARKRDAEMLAARRDVDIKWWQLCEAVKHAGQKGRSADDQMAEAQNTAAAEDSWSEQTMLTPPPLAAAGTELDFAEGNGHPRQQMAETPAAALQLAGTGTSFLTRQQVAASGELAKTLDTRLRQSAAAQEYNDAAAAHSAPMGLDVTPRLQQPPQPQDMVLQMAEAAAATDQELLQMLMQQLAAAEAPAKQDTVIHLLAAGAPQFDNLAARYEDTELDIMLGHGHPDMHQQTVQQMAEAQRVAAAAGEVAGEQGMAMPHAAAAELAGQGMMQLAAGAQQYAQTELNITLGHGTQQEIVQQMVQAQQLAAAAELAREQVAAAELAREQVMIVQQARQQEMEMAMVQATVAQKGPVVQYSETGLGISLGQGHPYRHQPTVQKLADAVEVARDASTTTMQQVAAYTDAEHGSDSGATVAFQPPGSAEAAPFLVEQQPPLQGQAARALGLQLDSSLLALLPSLGQPLAQVSQQQSADGGDKDQCSDLTAYFYY